MRGSIITRGNSYRIAVSLGKDSATGRYQKYFETVRGSKKDAQKRLTELLSQLDKGIFCRPGKTTLGEYLTVWLNDNIKPSLSPRTFGLYSYLSRVHLIPSIGNIPLTELKPHHLQRLYSEKLSSGLSARTVQLCHVALHKALKNAVKTNLLTRNVADSVDKPRIQHPEMHPMTETDINKFLEAAKQGSYYALFYT